MELKSFWKLKTKYLFRSLYDQNQTPGHIIRMKLKKKHFKGINPLQAPSFARMERATHTCAQKRAKWHFQRIGARSGNRRNLNYIRLVLGEQREATAAAVCAVGCNTRQTESVYWRLGCFLRAVWPQSGHYSPRSRRSNLPPRSLDPASNSPSVCWLRAGQPLSQPASQPRPFNSAGWAATKLRRGDGLAAPLLPLVSLSATHTPEMDPQRRCSPIWINVYSTKVVRL